MEGNATIPIDHGSDQERRDELREMSGEEMCAEGERRIQQRRGPGRRAGDLHPDAVEEIRREMARQAKEIATRDRIIQIQHETIDRVTEQARHWKARCLAAEQVATESAAMGIAMIQKGVEA